MPSLYVLHTENPKHNVRSSSSHPGISAVCEGAMLWKPYAEGRPPPAPCNAVHALNFQQTISHSRSSTG